MHYRGRFLSSISLELATNGGYGAEVYVGLRSLRILLLPINWTYTLALKMTFFSTALYKKIVAGITKSLDSDHTNARVPAYCSGPSPNRATIMIFMHKPPS
jgi:hypothetical protein